MMKNDVITHRDDRDGKVGIGKIPVELHPILDNISTEYYVKIPDKNASTYHTYYKDLTSNVKENFDKIQYNDFWNNICDNASNCIQQCVTEMNEIYYSNPKPHFEKTNLYGAAANLIPHRDCLLYNFVGIHFYRIIIGLTDNNDDTATEFINLHLEHKINRGDYMLFDFDRTLHQVTKTGLQETPRILLKLHFIVCENCKYSENYVEFVTYFYKYYYFVARYTEQIGTDPKTFTGFFFGLMWEWPFYTEFKYISILLFLSIFVALNRMDQPPRLDYKSTVILRRPTKRMGDGVRSKRLVLLRQYGKHLLHTSMILLNIYLLIVSGYYFRYMLYEIR
jgi:hypothetical protein